MSTYSDSSHLSSQPLSQLIPEFNGLVQSFYAETSKLANMVRVKQLRGTNSVIERRIGKGQLQKLTAGVEPPATPVAHGRITLVVDTVILAREAVDLLSTFQEDIDTRTELAAGQGKLHGEFFDQSFLVQVIKGSRQAAPTGLNGAIGAGNNVALAAANDELDPDKLYAGIANCVVQFENKKVPSESLVVFVSPTTYNVLLNNNKLVDTSYSGSNANYANRTIKTVAGCPIEKTTLIPDSVGTSLLSNADNNNAYDIDATDAKTVAVLLHPDSLLAAESIPLTSSVFWEDKDKSWYVDSHRAYGVTIKRPDLCGSVRRA